MPINIDTLQIEINASANKANQAIDKLVVKLDKLNTSLNGINGNNLTTLSNGINRLSQAMVTLNSVDSAKLGDVTSKIKRLSNIKADSLLSVSDNLNKIASSMRGLQSVSDSIKNLSDLANGIKQLGYKSATKAIDNIPKLATAMNQLMTELSKAPKVSQNLINMTNALAKLSRTGASSGRAASSLSKGWNIYSNSATRATKSTHSLASAFGKMYATYWLVFRAFGKLAEAIDISSQLTEVQNVVDVTFGSYVDKVEALADISIPQLGMSELETKKISSRFQAMGTAMGFAQGRMADMSVELTRLTADMASFYNVEQDVVAEDLEAIFTGQTRPMRQYGIDLTQATLKEWALKQGLDANIESMSQMEKTLLRYQYVMANTGAAQGDFLRTQNTWANQVRILKNNLQQLASVIGGTLINALKPLVKALNVAMQQLIAFAKTVSNALGKIFGWEYEAGTGGVTSDLETGADYADELAGGMDNAADAAKRLKSHLLSIDELNVLEPQKEEDSISGGGISGGLGDLGDEVSNGNWIKTDSLFKKFESEIDTLYKLGDYISQTLSRAMESIEWEKVYERARNFGKGLADFLNGLISPRLFGNVGKTIANSLNTVIQASLAFTENFDFEEFGISLAWAVNDFFDNFDFKAFAESINQWVNGIKKTIQGFLETLKWEDIISGIDDFLGTLELDTVAILIGSFAIKNTPAALAGLLSKSIISKISGAVITISAVDLMIADATKPEGMELGEYQYWRNEQINATNYVDSESFFNAFKVIKEKWNNVFGTASQNEERINATNYIDSESFTTTFSTIGTTISDWFENNVKPLFNIDMWYAIADGIKLGLQLKWEEIQQWWDETAIGNWWNNSVVPWFSIEKWNELLENVKTSFRTKWKETETEWSINIKKWWDNHVQPWFTKEKWLGLGENLKNGIYQGFKGLANKVVDVLNNVISALESMINNAISGINQMLSKINESGLGQFVGLNMQISGVSFGRIPRFATGGFPEDGLFFANHSELVGKFSNGKTAVANNEMIVAGIEDAAYKGFTRAFAENDRQTSLLEELIYAVREGKTISIDGRELVEIYDTRKSRNGFAF